MLPSMGSKMVLERDELIKFVKKELICTIGSADAPCTIPVLITLFREDTGKDIEQLARRLNYTSIQAMLESDEFRHIIEPCVTALAKGAGNNNPKEVYCYKLKPRDDFAHILTSIEQQQLSKEEEQRNKLKLFISNPKNRELALEGKERILHCLHKLGAENEAVPLVKLQQQYPAVWGVAMDKKELKKWFPTGKVQQIVFDFLYDEIETHEAQGQQGSLFFKMRKSFPEAMKGIEDSRKKFEEAKQMAEEMKRKKKKKAKGIGIVQVQVNVQVQQQPKKKERKVPTNLMVILPKKEIPNQLPKPKPVPILQKKDGIMTSKFATDDPEFFIQVKKAGEVTANQKVEELFDEICQMSDQLEEAKEENGKNKYTQMAEGAEATDSEAEFDEYDEDEEKENYVMNRWMKQLNSLNNTSTSSSSSNNNASPSKKAGDGQRMTLEMAKQIQLARQRDYIAFAKKDQEKSRKTCGQFVRQATSKKVGKLRKIQWTGRRAKEAAVRKERQENLLAKLQAKWVADGMPIKERLRSKSEFTKAMLAALLSQMLWAHNHLGVTEAERMLHLMLFNYEFEVNVKELVKERIPIAKFFCGPEEEEYITFKYNISGVLDGTAGYKKKKKLAAH